jgi:hypothetical protein
MIAFDGAKHPTELVEARRVTRRAIAAFQRVVRGTVEGARRGATLAYEPVGTGSEEGVVVCLGEREPAIDGGSVSRQDGAEIPSPEPRRSGDAERRQSRG